MSGKEFVMFVLAFALGYVVGTIILSKLPTSLGGGSQWEE
jgi:hypothetical protein